MPLSHFKQDVENLPHLSEVPAVTLIEDPLPAICAVGNMVLDHILRVEQLPCSLSGYLADHNWPLKVHLHKEKTTGSTVGGIFMQVSRVCIGYPFPVF